MKQAICNRKNILKGVSTLNMKVKNLEAILLLLVTILSGAIYGGHSTLNRVDPEFDAQIQIKSLGLKKVSVVAPMLDGKILVSGSFSSYNDQTVGGLVRINPDATLDTSFKNDLFFSSSKVVRIIPITGGKTLVCGTLTIRIQTGNPFPQIVRLNSDGTLDATFSYSGGGSVSDCAVDADNRIIMAGAFSDAGSGTRRVIRINESGSLDTSFQFVSNQTADTVTTQNNKILVALSNNGFSPSVVMRLNEDGTNDSSFTAKNLNSTIKKLLVQADAKILVLGRNTLLRLNENGGDDGSFTPINLSSNAETMFLLNDGRITLSHGSGSQVQIKRFLANGTADNSFTTYQATNFSTFGQQTDGSVIIGDAFNGESRNTIPNFFIRLSPNGSPDPSFNSGLGFQTFFLGASNVRAIAVQLDGKIVIGGSFDLVNGIPRFKIARLNKDSTIDTSFQIKTNGTGNVFGQLGGIFHITAQTDGKLIVSGNFSYTVNGIVKTNLVRLNSDGSIDSTFVIGTQVPDLFTCCLGGTNKSIPLTDGKILVGTSRQVGYSNTAPVKFNSDGTLDTTFNGNALYPGSMITHILDIAVQPDGKIIIGGTYEPFRTINDPAMPKSFITRLNVDGSVDQTFQTTEELNKRIGAVALLPDGKILISKYAGNGGIGTQNLVLRLNSDGSPDSSFNAGTGAGGKINALLVLPTGKIMVGGLFSGFNGHARENLALLNPNGSLNETTYRLNDEVQSLAIDNDGGVLVSGVFSIITVNGEGSNRTGIARLMDLSQTATRRTRFDFNGDGRADLGVFNKTNGMWSIRHSQNNQTVSTQFGLNTDKTAAADFDGDGKTDIAVYRPSEGNWYLLQSTNGFAAVRWGVAEDKPVPADFDSDGRADIAVWRPSTGVWYILQSSNSQLLAFGFGLSTDIPLRDVDFDGDSRADIAVWRPSNGYFYWLASGSQYQFRAVQFGSQGDIPVAADYNGDGQADLAVFRPSNGYWYQYLTTPNGTYEFQAVQFGLQGDEPVAADYNGDGRADIALRRQSMWHFLMSSQSYSSTAFGNGSEQAIVSLEP